MVESASTFDKLPSVQALKQHFTSVTSKTHLRDLLTDDARNQQLRVALANESSEGKTDAIFDFTHAKIDVEGYKALLKVADEANLFSKIDSMFKGEKINNTEKRSVLHVALRMRETESLVVPDSEEGDAVKNVHAVLHRIHEFSQKIRTGEAKGFSGRDLKNTLIIGIGGSYLGPEFVFEALRTDEASSKGAAGRKLKFLANVDPIDFTRAIDGLDIEETLVVINSKTFTTAETMLNARTVRQHIIDHYSKKYPEQEDKQKFVEAHMCAVSTNLPETKKFGV